MFLLKFHPNSKQINSVNFRQINEMEFLGNTRESNV